MKKTIRIKLSPEAEEVYKYLNKEVAQAEKIGKRTPEVQIFQAFEKKKDLIKINHHYGEPISKSKIPKQYRQTYGITNLFWVELPHFWRLLYSLTDGADGLVDQNFTLTENITASSRGQPNECLKITAANVEIDCNGFSIDNKFVKHWTVTALNQQGAKIRNCKFAHSRSHTLILSGGNDAVVTNSTFDRIFDWSGVGALISGNTFTDWRLTVDGSNAIVEDNLFEMDLSNELDAIVIGQDAHDNIIRNNVFRQPNQLGDDIKTGNAITIYSSAYENNVTNNTITGFRKGLRILDLQSTRIGNK